ncbi:hypothetical protein T492DRAFT_844135 [Pavlovales sp. CCMP2436]|nr:hypothetical protein T492DRAFT_844135 [Pavlovales sp. CCMP2436]
MRGLMSMPQTDRIKTRRQGRQRIECYPDIPKYIVQKEHRLSGIASGLEAGVRKRFSGIAPDPEVGVVTAEAKAAMESEEPLEEGDWLEKEAGEPPLETADDFMLWREWAMAEGKAYSAEAHPHQLDSNGKPQPFAYWSSTTAELGRSMGKRV